MTHAPLTYNAYTLFQKTGQDRNCFSFLDFQDAEKNSDITSLLIENIVFCDVKLYLEFTQIVKL